MTRLFSYKMTEDTGFAPNPFHGFLTLATCKPMIRKHKQVGDWIAGFTSIKLTKARDGIGDEKLVYLMHVTSKVMLADYWRDTRYSAKRPHMKEPGPIPKAGDNIYRPVRKDPTRPEHFRQLGNKNHKPKDQVHDLNGQYVLISDEYYYFGRDALQVPGRWRPNVPRAQSAHGVLTEGKRAEDFINYIRSKFKLGIIGTPHRWKDVKEE